VHNKIAHTAEHAFIGSLQKLIGKTLQVRKVEHRQADNSVFITTPHLDLELIIKAQSEVNSLISTGGKVITHSFVSLGEAKKRFPGLRANEERIEKESSSIRVIEIEGHDVAACAMDHAHDLSECVFFLVKKVSKSGNEHEINFVVEKQAKEAAIILSLKLLNICSDVGANFNTVENTIRKLKVENEIYLSKLKNLTKEKLDNIVSYTADRSKIIIIRGIFSGLIQSEIRSYAGRKITEYNTVVVIANINQELDEPSASIVLARNESLVGIDCDRLFRESSGNDGRGGGKPHFVIGTVNKQRVVDIVKNIVNAISNQRL
jgi:alanyl-tRNA synthetase